MPASRFSLNRFAIMSLMQIRGELYRESLFALKLESQPVAVPFGINEIFPGQASASHLLITQYFAISDYMALVFSDVNMLLDKPTEVEAKVCNIYVRDYETIFEAFNDRLWVDDLTVEMALDVCETFLTLCMRLLANARQLSMCRRPNHQFVDTYVVATEELTIRWPYDMNAAPKEALAEFNEACAVFNRSQDRRYEESKMEEEGKSNDEENKSNDEESKMEEMTQEMNKLIV
jgi:hypothetical protein